MQPCREDKKEASMLPRAVLPKHELIGLSAQFSAEVGVGDRNQVFHPLTQGAAPQTGDAIFGNDVIRAVAGNRNSRAWSEGGLDFRDGTAL